MARMKGAHVAKFNPFNKHSWEKFGSEVEHAFVDDLGGALEDVFVDEVGGAMTDFGKEVERGWKKEIETPFKRKVIDGIEHDVIVPSSQAFSEVEVFFVGAKNSIVDEVKSGVDAVTQQAVAKLVSAGLKQALAVLEIATPSSMSLQLGPFVITIDDVKDRLGTMRRWIDHPPVGRESIKEMILTFSPSTVTVSISAQIAFLVVSSSSLSVGFDLTFGIEDYWEHADAIFNEFRI